MPTPTIARVIEACAHETTDAKQLYRWRQHARYGVKGSAVQIAERLHAAGLTERYYVACGSGAIPKAAMKRLRELGVKGACFNLEVWDPVQFERVCPGKHAIVGRDRWLESLEDAVDVFGRGHVKSAFVGGAELVGDGVCQTPDEALRAPLRRRVPRRSGKTTRVFSLTGK